MSYSFSITADSKADAKQKVADQFDNVVSVQASHAADRDAVVACAGAFIDTLADPDEGDEIYVVLYGSLIWRHEVPEEFTGAQVSVNASLRKKPATE